MEGRYLSRSNTEHVYRWCLCSFSLVSGEHVFWTINIFAEMEVVNFFVVASVTVLPNHQVKYFITWRHQIKLFKHSQELLLGNVLRLGSVEVHEVWLKQNSVRDDVSV